MSKHIKGSVWQKRGYWYFGFPLRDEDRERAGRDRYVAKIPPRRDGNPIDKAYATGLKNERVFAYEHRKWNPLDDDAEVQPGAPLTVREYGRKWLDRQTNANIVGDRMWFENFIAPTDLGRMQLGAVRPRHIKAFVEALKVTPAKKGGTLAPRTVRNIHSIVHRIFAAATFDEVIPASPAGTLPRGTLPKIVDKNPLERRTWIREWKDVEALMTKRRVPPDRRVLYALEHLTGCRFSEIAAARWLAWDEKRKPLGCLSIAYSRDLHTGKDKPTKTGVPREVPVHPRLAVILRAWRDGGWEAHYGHPPKPTDRIVPSRSGEARDPRNNWTRHDEDCKALKIRRIRQHGARHTFISALANAGVSREVRNEITHGRAPDVQGGYTHLAWSVLCDAVKKLPVKTGAKRGRG